ncbi:MAG: asparagine synthase (glutamine-hydrolyzing) [Armatimonadota bacterium]
MCGIVGYWATKGRVERDLIEAMATRICHRGPDDAGVWLDEAAGLALGHRRLAILDLSHAGHQPMISHCQRYVIVYNGEIYNHMELRAELEKAYGPIAWRGHSDTETLLEAVSRWGIETTLKRAVGMFAFAIWDRQERNLMLARDRMGEKPLYYGYQNGVFFFASELKALTVHPQFERRIDLDALALYLQLGYVPAPHSIYQSIHKLFPGTMVIVREQDIYQQLLPDPMPYWSLPLEPSVSVRDVHEAVDQLDDLLRQSIRGQMVADVPVGAFLSGGIDSSTVVALMQAESSTPVYTFTIGFHEAHYNEAPYAKAVATHLGTNHSELYLTPAEVQEIIPIMPQVYDEPFADPSQLPTYLVARLARNTVTVCLSGDGGDELFAGYPRYPLTVALTQHLQRFAKIPYRLRRLLLSLLQITPTTLLNHLTPRRYRQFFTEKRLAYHHQQRLVQILKLSNPTIENVYQFMITNGLDPREFLYADQHTEFALFRKEINSRDAYTAMCTIDALSYLPDDILVKVDRATMAVSLEARAPLLDYRIVEYAWRLPSHLKVREGKGKWILRQILYRYVPPEIVERPKAGFGIPLYQWLRGPLREWAEELLSETSLRRSGLLRPYAIRRYWHEHLNEISNWEYLLWKFLMFQAWYLQR